MKALILGIVVCALLVAVPVQAQTSPITSFTVAVTTSEGTVNWPFKDFTCCVNGAGGVTFDCSNTISATKGLIRNGQCPRFEGDTPCGVLHWMGAAASTIDCFAWK